MVVHVCNVPLGRLRQEDWQFETTQQDSIFENREEEKGRKMQSSLFKKYKLLTY